jgi:uncharacterized damage-inducible protein DinB
MTTHDAVALIDYSYWARDRVLDAVGALTAEQYTQDLRSSFPSVRDTLVHTYSAEWIWHQRWLGSSPTSPIPFDRFADVAALAAAWRELEGDIRAFVRNLGDAGLDHALDYHLLSGAAGRSTYREMIQHVVNHGTYHRGQVTTMLRQLGAPPPASLDLIVFSRGR